MKATRLTGIPLPHVTAEMAAFPLASEDALRLRVQRLDPALASGTSELWRAAERAIVRNLPGLSIEEAVAIRDKMWFGDDAHLATPLHRYLRRIADEHLWVQGAAAVPRLHPEELRPVHDTPQSREALARWRWRWLSLALPPDLLVAALTRPGKPLPGRVDCLSRTVERQLADHGFVESHLHLGAALDFPLAWVLLLHAIALRDVDSTLFRSPGAELDEGRDLGPLLARAATMRYVLAAFLSPSQRVRPLEDFIVQVVRPELAASLGGGWYAVFIDELGHLRGSSAGPSRQVDFRSWQMLYRDLAGLSGDGMPAERDLALARDPIARHLAPDSTGGLGAEAHFVAHALDYLEGADGRDALFEQVFWQIVRVRCLVYRHLLHRPLTPGLQWFIRFYDRLGPVKRLAPYRLRLDSAASLCGRQAGLRSLEIRISPDQEISETYQELQQLLGTYLRLKRQAEDARGTPLEFGIVYHFARNRGGGALSGLPKGYWRDTHADPTDGARFRYAGFFRTKEREALALIWTLRTMPTAVEVIRGVDVCTDEMGVPFWVIAPLLRATRQAGDEAIRWLHTAWGREVPPLRTTVHAGEDFVHLLTGLRQIDEAIHLFGLREGDRLGHALALGVDPHDWALRAGRVAIPREVRLFDLAWEWHWYRRNDTPVPKRRRSLLEYEIHRLGCEVFGAGLGANLEIHHLIGVVERLHRGSYLYSIGFPDGASAGRGDALDGRTVPLEDRLAWAYLTCPDTFRRGRMIEWIDPETEGEALAAIQAGLRRNINNRGFVIEVNPSSNLLIGDLGDLARHPLWRLHPPEGDHSELKLPVCIGSDDPLTFGTTLPYEYQLVYDTLILSGVSSENARRWIDDARARGVDGRFTLQRPVSDDLLSYPRLVRSPDPVLLAD